MELCACLVLYSDCQCNYVRVQQSIGIVGNKKMHVYKFIVIVAGIVFLFSKK